MDKNRETNQRAIVQTVNWINTMARANAKPRSAIKDVVSREYTVNLHKVKHRDMSV